ncbi:MAG: cytochrome c oxidase subunit II [Gaiellaceae bacterium]
MKAPWVALLLPALVPLTGCGGNQNTVHPASPQQQAIATLWWVMLGGAAIGFAFILVLLILGWVRRNRENLPFGIGERGGTRMVVGFGVAMPVVLLSALFIWSDVFVIQKTQPAAASSTSLTVRVIGHQWFWEFRYPGGAVNANELHIPVDTKVNVVGTTGDVIHSFWVPELNRKIDLIPGRTNRVTLQADRTGVFRGQCAEFCGLQHANMAELVFVQPRAAFRSWLANQARPARAAGGRGSELFQADCSGCHQIRGTAAQGQVGPDLTHVASRTTLAGVAIRNTPALLGQWLADPQRIKPDNKMPKLDLSPRDVKALVAYLEELK